MINKTKGSTGRHQATPKISNSVANFTDIVARAKAAIVTLAVWGWFPQCAGGVDQPLGRDAR